MGLAAARKTAKEREEQERRRLAAQQKEMGAPTWVIAPVNWVLLLTAPLWLGTAMLIGHFRESFKPTMGGEEFREHWLGRRWLWK